MVRKTEADVMQLHQQGLLNVTHFRYPLVYGTHNICPAEWGIIRRAIDKRKPLIMPAGGLTLISRGFAENIAHAVLLAVENPSASAGQTYNIADDTLLHNHQWVALLSDMLNHSFELIDIPFASLPAGFRCTPPQLLYRHHCVADISKIKQQLGYRDVVSVPQALQRTVDFYLKNPIKAGSEAEQNLGDPFDYAYEDLLIETWKNHRHIFAKAIDKLPAPKVIWKHPYAG